MPSPLSLLTDLTRQLQGAHAFGDLLELIATRCAELLGCRRASIRLLDPDGSKLLASCRAGNPLHLDPNEEFELGEGLLGWIVEHGEPILTGHAEQDERFAAKPGMKEPLQSFVGVPLIASDCTLGVLSGSSPDADAFGPLQLERLMLLGGIAAPHIEIARRDFVARDPLTGLFNHARFQQTVEREIERSLAYGLPFSLVLCDLDNFGTVNDSRGHQVGDALLKAVAEILAGRGPRRDLRFRMRAQDAVARYGGDELGLLLPHTPKEGAIAKAEVLRGYLEGCDLSALDLPPQTVSLGVATVPDDAYDRASLIAAAERALAAAKRSGRNTTVGYSRALEVAHAADNAHALDLDVLIGLEATIESRAFGYVYQPIVEAKTHAVVAYEALCRPQDERFSGPAALFEAAERAGRVIQLGRVCREISLLPAARLPEGCALFINLHPRELDDTVLMREPQLSQWADRLVLEITETAAIEDYDRVRRVIARLRQRGCRIALDDLGSGYAGLNALAQLQPDFVKLDMALVRRIDTKSATRRLVKHILEYCAGEGIPVISEGVETAEEHDMVRHIGSPLLQGDFIASPAPPFVEVGEVAE